MANRKQKLDDKVRVLVIVTEKVLNEEHTTNVETFYLESKQEARNYFDAACEQAKRDFKDLPTVCEKLVSRGAFTIFVDGNYNKAHCDVTLLYKELK